MNETSFERIDRVLREAFECHRSIHDITSQIGRLVESGDGAGAVCKLTERGHGLQQLRSLHEHLNALIEEAHLTEPGARDRLESYRSVGKRLASWVEVTLSLDAEHERLVTEAKRELSNRLSTIKESKRQINDRRYYERDRRKKGRSFLG